MLSTEQTRDPSPRPRVRRTASSAPTRRPGTRAARSPTTCSASSRSSASSGMLVPEEYGGLGLRRARPISWSLEELAWGDAAVALSVSIHNGPVAGLLHPARHRRAEGALAARLWRRARLLGRFRALARRTPGAMPAVAPDERGAGRRGWRDRRARRSGSPTGRRAGLVVVFARTGARRDRRLPACRRDADGVSVEADASTTMGLRASETVDARARRRPSWAARRFSVSRVRGLPVCARGAGPRSARGSRPRPWGSGGRPWSTRSGYAVEREQFGRPICADSAPSRRSWRTWRRRIAAARALAHEGAAVQAEADRATDGTGARARRRHRTGGGRQAGRQRGRDLGRRRGGADLRWLRVHARLPGREAAPGRQGHRDLRRNQRDHATRDRAGGSPGATRGRLTVSVGSRRHTKEAAGMEIFETDGGGATTSSSCSGTSRSSDTGGSSRSTTRPSGPALGRHALLELRHRRATP